MGVGTFHRSYADRTMPRFSFLSLARNALTGHRGWTEQWRSQEPKAAYGCVIIGAGGHGLATDLLPRQGTWRSQHRRAREGVGSAAAIPGATPRSCRSTSASPPFRRARVRAPLSARLTWCSGLRQLTFFESRYGAHCSLRLGLSGGGAERTSRLIIGARSTTLISCPVEECTPKILRGSALGPIILYGGSA